MWAFPNRSGSFRPRFLPGRAVARPDGSKLIAEPLFVPESSSTAFQRFDADVHTFSMTVVHLPNYRVENAPKVIPQGLRRRLHRFKLATSHPVNQALPPLFSPGATPVAPKA